MELIPAIDILGGKVVRLHQGRYDRATVYGDDPSEAARRFEQAGARRLHVVDLDGARNGRPGNVGAIERILSATGLAVQVGGGIRDAAAAQRWWGAGAQHVILGTAAVDRPELVRDLARRRDGSVVVALDARDDEIAVDGWQRGTGQRVREVAREVDGWGVAAILFTNIAHDGTKAGPDVEGTAALQSAVDATVIASGGIGSLEHLRALAAAGVRAAVCGRALYTGAFTPEQAFRAAAEEA